MSAIETFKFGSFTMRPAGEGKDDARLAAEWTAADPDHAGKVIPEFWLQQSLTRDAYVVVDGNTPLLFFKTILYESGNPPIKWVQLHVQFSPSPQDLQARRFHNQRVIRAMAEGFGWLERVLLLTGIQMIFFDSDSKSLIAFCTRKLGFIQKGSQLRKDLSVVARSMSF